jgi:hypothetical protein
MKRTRLNILPCLCAGIALMGLTSCGSRDDIAKTKEFHANAEALTPEADRLAGEAAQIQQSIRDVGGEETTGPRILATLQETEKSTIAEGQRLQKIADGLKTAVGQIEKEQTAFTQKYLKP